MTASRSGIPQVIVLVPLALKGHRDCFEGILRYARVNGPWRLYRREGRTGEQRLRDMKRWGCSGIITGACTLREARAIAGIRVPVVLYEPDPRMLVDGHPLSKYSCLRVDSFATGEHAARFFLDRHYERFAFVGGGQDMYWSRERGEGFRKTVEAAGGTVSEYRASTAEERHDWAIEQPRMEAWLKSLPKPVALFAAMDGRARQVLDACLDAGISVPEEVAVLGVDDDPLICEATFPTLSSIQHNSEHAGYLLAEHLDKLMRGKRLRQRVDWIKPTRVVKRRSTEATAIADKQVARACEYIWREAGHQAIGVTDVVSLFGSSRRYAETRFKTVVGRTIMEEIRRVKLERVCALLSETNLSIGEIAQQCDFARESHLAFVFRKQHNMTMSEYRAATRRLA
ncbi:MAG: XylR family transcriptional regulator [Verrucomicrobia bacterium]|nr:XylR family transcriptional regulator [Verrucomicrobiota bacterium]MBT7065791.1 XylR family transcriptional regulator [Verrucomicrobiota bacterium]MBT7701296.1 XylR family transcriptional regulator [Verrucomicrobiota bacterium]